MHHPERHFFDIPIYRCTEDAFNAAYDSDLKKSLQGSDGQPLELSAESRRLAEQIFWENYGGPWRYNQVVAWLRLFVLGTQIRGDLWILNTKRLVRRMRYKQFRLSGKEFEIWCHPNESSADILRRIDEELRNVQKGYHNGRIHLDREQFDELAKHVDWRGLVGL